MTDLAARDHHPMIQAIRARSASALRWWAEKKRGRRQAWELGLKVWLLVDNEVNSLRNIRSRQQVYWRNALPDALPIERELYLKERRRRMAAQRFKP